MFKQLYQVWQQLSNKGDKKSHNAEQPQTESNAMVLKSQRLLIAMVVFVVLISGMVALFFSQRGQKPEPKRLEPVLFSRPADVTGANQQGLLALQQGLAAQGKVQQRFNDSLEELTQGLTALHDAQLKTQQQLRVLDEKARVSQQMLTKKDETTEKTTKTPPPWQFNRVDLVANAAHAKTPFVPAGSYVTAVLLSGVDVSAGVNATSDPKPVLLRTTAPFHLPSGKTLAIDNCRIVGASFGEVSSERAYIRLERLSCHLPAGWLDIPVYGYVAGPDGKAGIQGKVAIRDRAMVSRAFLGGLVGGMGETVANQLTTTHVSPLGTTLAVKAGDGVAYGTGQGVHEAASQLANYYIKRAEQYQPVIHVLAGTTVDVVFHQGFLLKPRVGTEKEQSKKLKTNNNQASLAALLQHSTDSDE